MIKAGYYEDIITVEDGLLFRTVVAHWAATRRRDGGYYAVYRIDENGKEYCRALMYSICGGYYIDEDDLKKRSMFDKIAGRVLRLIAPLMQCWKIDVIQKNILHLKKNVV